MTATAAPAPPRGAPPVPPPGRGVTWLDSPNRLVLLFVVGLAVRLIAAKASGGLQFDVQLFRDWSNRLVQRGPAGFYERNYFADYPPGYLYVLLILGRAWRVLTGGPPSVAVLKLPAIFADLGLALLATAFAAKVTAGETAQRGRARALAAAAVLLNPALILVSSVWGQVDSVLALLVCSAAYVLATGAPRFPREAGGVGLLAVALATKPQAVLALPVLAVVAAYRHAPPRGMEGRRLALAWARILARAGALAAIAGVIVLLLFRPFHVYGRDIPMFYRIAGSLYRFTSLWAFNLWGIVGFYRADSGAGAVTVAGVPAFLAGLALAAAATGALALRAWRSLARGVDPAAVALFGMVAVTGAAFALLTRMHERYLYLAVAGLAPFVGRRPLRWALIALSVGFFLDLHFVYVYFSRNSYPPGDAWTIGPLYRAIFGAVQDAWQRKALSALLTAACLGVAALGWRSLERTAARPSS